MRNSSRRRGRARFTIHFAIGRLVRELPLLLVLIVVGACNDESCISDTECIVGEMCIGGLCSIACQDTSDCSEEQACLADLPDEDSGVLSSGDDPWEIPPRCVPESCECEDNEICVSGGGNERVCVRLDDCSINAPCPDGFLCNALGRGTACFACPDGECGPECERDADCRAPLVCDDEGACIVDACEDADDCRASGVCGIASRTSGAGAVQSFRGCVAEGELSVGDLCAVDADCETGLCLMPLAGVARCAAECEDSDDCDEDLCLSVAARADLSLSVCVAGEIECADNERVLLSNSQLVCSNQARCDADAECPPGGTCVQGRCACVGEFCGVECDEVSDCVDGLDCLDDTCRLPTTCESTRDCEDDRLCGTHPGQEFIEDHCYPQGDLDFGEECDRNSECASSHCFSGLCAERCSTSNPCDEGGCRPQATGDSVQFLCSSEPCDCREGEVCTNAGTCILDKAGCDRQRDCERGQMCLEGVCAESCADTGDCGDGEVCALWQSAGEYACAAERGDCSSDEVLFEGECREASSCDDNADCDDATCVLGQCLRNCDRSRDCEDDEQCIVRNVDGESLRLCSAAECDCSSRSAWCVPGLSSDEADGCFIGDNCSRCPVQGSSDNPLENYQCSQLDVPIEGDVQASCECADPLECGPVCEEDSECSRGLTCSVVGRCVPPGVCLVNEHCSSGQDCVYQNVFSGVPGEGEFGQCEAVCDCQGDQDRCIVSPLEQQCVSTDRCSLLAETDPCANDYTCDVELQFCVCTGDSCAGTCDAHADCGAGQICEAERCTVTSCADAASCPAGTTCGVVEGERRCVRPGVRADLELCESFADCQSGHCYANNACATPCASNSECLALGNDTSCQRINPAQFFGVPICSAAAPRCELACSATEFCDNDELLPSCMTLAP